jgi:hypothetical protein
MLPRLILVAALIVAAAGCMRDAPSFDVDGRFTPTERAVHATAAASWNAVSYFEITLDGGEWHLLRIPPPDTRWTGQTDRDLEIIWIHPNSATDLYVAEHEFGHALGLHHLLDGGVMTQGSGATKFTKCDLIECGRVGACPPLVDASKYECPRGPP